MAIAWPHFMGISLCLYSVVLCMRLFLVRWYHIYFVQQNNIGQKQNESYSTNYSNLLKDCFSL